MNYPIDLTELDTWVKNTAKPGDIAYYFSDLSNSYYLYIYKGFDVTPSWRRFMTIEEAQKYLDENKEPEMKKRCENCVFYITGAKGEHMPFCSHPTQVGVYVPKFTVCDNHKFKKPGPFDNLKFFIKDQNTGELELKYICEDCGKVMNNPDYWHIKLPLIGNGKQSLSTTRPGYYFYCEECNKKKEGKI